VMPLMVVVGSAVSVTLLTERLLASC
jgi:hypothetical protein